jgi:hypothetical protein
MVAWSLPLTGGFHKKNEIRSAQSEILIMYKLPQIWGWSIEVKCTVDTLQLSEMENFGVRGGDGVMDIGYVGLVS